MQGEARLHVQTPHHAKRSPVFKWSPRLSSSGKRWRICGLGRRFKPYTMQREARYLSGAQGLALVAKGGGFRLSKILFFCRDFKKL
ncbi:hypothetical protein H5410_027597 [Solanum commersonii]|uniref:Uncharacterized protein n=1 Tax=Solanum commersonii TaxID=4109 RepID=A0A9J5YZM0_SOLCO|nr:hypothetical protein H5410_027597 [Solanum commersonii]